MKQMPWLLLLLVGSSVLVSATDYQRGTIVRMHMTDCVAAHHGIMATLAGSPVQQTPDMCPEYTLVSDKVVYRIIGKSSNSVIPLAESTTFRFEKNELLIRIDDAKNESHFVIMEMTLRGEWERERQRLEQAERAGEQRRMETDLAMSRSR